MRLFLLWVTIKMTDKIDYVEALMEVFIKDSHTGSSMKKQLRALLKSKRAESEDIFVSAPIKVPDKDSIQSILDGDDDE